MARLLFYSSQPPTARTEGPERAIWFVRRQDTSRARRAGAETLGRGSCVCNARATQAAGCDHREVRDETGSPAARVVRGEPTSPPSRRPWISPFPRRHRPRISPQPNPPCLGFLFGMLVAPAVLGRLLVRIPTEPPCSTHGDLSEAGVERRAATPTIRGRDPHLADNSVVGILLVPLDPHPALVDEPRQVFLGTKSSGLIAFWCVNAGQAYLMPSLGCVENGNGVTVRDAHYRAGEVCPCRERRGQRQAGRDGDAEYPFAHHSFRTKTRAAVPPR